MRLVRGALSEVEVDSEVTRQLAAQVERSGQPALRVWTPPKQVAFGRRDTTRTGYERAREASLERDYEPVERAVGGHAVAYTGTTVAFAHLVAVDTDRTEIGTRYRRATDRLTNALESIGVEPARGEPEASFCPGAHSLQHDGKIAGIAQRVRRNCAVVGGCVVVTERDESRIAEVLSPVYEALGLPFEPGSVGSVEGAGGTGGVDAVVDAVESAFLPDCEVEVDEAAAVLA